MLSRFETLQTYDQDRWRLVDLKGLGCLDVLLALATIPLVIFIKQFRDLELFQAIIESDGTFFAIFLLSILKVWVLLGILDGFIHSLMDLSA